MVLGPRCGGRTSRTPEWAPGTPDIASAAAIVARRGGEPAHRLSSLCRGRAGGRAGFRTPRGAARIGVALQAGAGHRSQAEGDGTVGREPARARAVHGVRLDRAWHGPSLSRAARAGVAAIRAGV